MSSYISRNPLPSVTQCVCVYIKVPFVCLDILNKIFKLDIMHVCVTLFRCIGDLEINVLNLGSK
jgi:hypothetical protein